MVPDGKAFPDGALRVVSVDINGGILSVPYAGGEEVVLQAYRLVKFRRFDGAFEFAKYNAGRFSLDGVKAVFDGFSSGEKYIDGEIPFFVFDEACKVAKSMETRFCKESNAFFSNDGLDLWPASVIEVDGQKIAVYGIGARYWPWKSA